MGLETAVVASLVLAGVSAAASAKAAQDQNKSIAQSRGAAAKARSLQNTQLREQARVEQEKQKRRAAQVRGNIRVASASKGLGDGGTSLALLSQADFDEAFNIDIINQNRDSAFARTASELEAIGINLSAGQSNSLLAAFSGGVQGFSTGLSITGGMQDAGAGTTTNTPATPTVKGPP